MTPDHHIEALAESLYRTTDLNLPLSDSLDIDCHDAARALLASDASRALVAGERAAALREAADQLDRDGMKRLSARLVKQWLHMRADRMTP